MKSHSKLIVFLLAVFLPLIAEDGELRKAPLSGQKGKWNQTDYIWNYNIASACDVIPFKDPSILFVIPDEVRWDVFKWSYEHLKPGDSVWLWGGVVTPFFKNIVPQLKVPIVLVIVAGDHSFPSQYDIDIENVLKNDNIVHIFAVNNDYKGTSNKITHIPIGIDFHTAAYNCVGDKSAVEEQERVLKQILQGLQPTHMRKPRAFVDFQHSDTMLNGDFKRYLEFGEDRTSIFENLKKTQLIDYSERLQRSDLWRKKGEYAFSISPHGNGLDCHRTWEDLVLGCIVIVKSSPLDQMYEGLPVVIIKDWSEINSANLQKWHKQYGDAFTNPSYRQKLTNQYWINLIRQKSEPFKKSEILHGDQRRLSMEVPA